MLDNRYALLFIRGECAVMGEKFNILKHPNVKLTADGGKAPYCHGGADTAVATVLFKTEEKTAPVPAAEKDYDSGFELLSEQELQEQFEAIK